MNLRWALDRARAAEDPLDFARGLEREQEQADRRIAAFGAELLVPGTRALTHCNTGALATGGYGTAGGVLTSAHEAGRLELAWVTETRPLLQGARLTAWELQRAGVPFRLITDSSVGALMERRLVDAVVVGADRIAANGDVANKIGTYPIAVLAARHGIPFYVAAPLSTLDPSTPSGGEIPIEERDPSEVLGAAAPEGAEALNLAFDITPAELVTAIVTEDGVFEPAEPAVVIDADALLAGSRRPLVLGIGGGGDVVGALATAEACRLYHGAGPVVGGVTWERRVIDPLPGPRSAAEIEDGRELAPGVLAAGPDTRVRENGVLFAEARMAAFLGEETVLVDVTRAPRDIAGGIEAAALALGCDLVVFVDVGGDALAHGDEPGLASPLCDALMLAAASWIAELPVLGGVFGTGCDGELTPAEVLDRVAELAAAGGLAGVRGLTPAVAERLEAAVEEVPTEASAQALRCFRGEHGTSEIRGGRRTVQLTPLGATTIYFDVAAALGSAARLAAAVRETSGLEDANETLHGLGVRTELDYERDMVDR